MLIKKGLSYDRPSKQRPAQILILLDFTAAQDEAQD
jgi:hypothetical protein